MCLSEQPLYYELRQKLSMFCNVSPRAVIEAADVRHTAYEVPLMLHDEGLDGLICEQLGLKTPEPELTNWRKFAERVLNPRKPIRIALVCKYTVLQATYK